MLNCTTEDQGGVSFPLNAVIGSESQEISDDRIIAVMIGDITAAAQELV